MATNITSIEDEEGYKEYRTNLKILDSHGCDISTDYGDAYTPDRVLMMLAIARAEGFKEGYKEGRRAAAEQTRRELGEVILTLKEKYDVGTYKHTQQSYPRTEGKSRSGRECKTSKGGGSR